MSTARSTRRVVALLAFALLAPALLPLDGAPELAATFVGAAAAAAPRASEVAFEANHGQAPAEALFVARDGPGEVRVTRDGAVMVVRDEGGAAAAVRMRVAGAEPDARVEGLEALPGVVHYLRGDESEWVRDVPRFARVAVRDVLPGIDVEFYGTPSGRVEYDVVVAPGADPSRLRFEFEGADGIRVDEDGALVLATPAGDVRHRAPFAYQDDGGARREVAADFAVSGSSVTFRLGPHDPALPLVVDPMMEFGTFLGGSNTDYAGDARFGPDGSAYLLGTTSSLDLLVREPFDATYGGYDDDAFVAKFDPSGELVFSTYLGGGMREVGAALGFSPTGDVVVVGRTSSSDFPGADLEPPLSRAPDVFVVTLAPRGDRIVSTTVVRTVGSEIVHDAAVTRDGRVVVVGESSSSDLPALVAPCLPETYRTSGFILSVSVTGTVEFSRCLHDLETAYAVAVDASGNAFVAGPTSYHLQGTVASAFGRSYSIGRADGLAVKVSPEGSVAWSVNLGGTGDDHAADVAVDDARGAVIVGGGTYSTDFPVFGDGAQPSPQVIADVFLIELDASDASPRWSSFAAGARYENLMELAIGEGGRVYAAGVTSSRDFPLLDASHETFESSFWEGFMVAFDATDHGALEWSTLLGFRGTVTAHGGLDAQHGRILVAATADSGGGLVLNETRNEKRVGYEAYVASYLDCSAPATRLNMAGVKGADHYWWRSDVAFRVVASPACGAPVADVRTAVDGASLAPETVFTVTGEGPHDVRYFASYADGRTEPLRQHSFGIDSVPPRTILNASAPPYGNGCYSGPTTIHVQHSDATSGIAWSSVQLDGAPTSSRTFHFDGSRVQELLYWSKDRAGNVEPTRVVPIIIDGVPPVTTVTVSPEASSTGWHLAPVVVEAAAFDAAGPPTTFVSLDGAAPAQGDVVVVDVEGAHAVSAHAVDGCGVAGEPRLVQLRIDLAPPTATPRLRGEPGSNGWWRSAVDVDVSASDAASGVADVLVAVDDAPLASGTRVRVTGDGEHRVHYRAVDAAGRAADGDAIVRIDTTAPEAAFLAPASGTVTVAGATADYPPWLLGSWPLRGELASLPEAIVVGATTVSVDALDARSGVVRVEFRVDGRLFGEASRAPYEVEWDAGAEAPGRHVLEATAFDEAGNSVTIRMSVATAPSPADVAALQGLLA